MKLNASVYGYFIFCNGYSKLFLTSTTQDCPIAEEDKGKISFLGNEVIIVDYNGLFIPRMELTITRNKWVSRDKIHIIFLKLRDYSELRSDDAIKYATDLSYTEHIEERKNVEVSVSEDSQTIEAPEMNVKEGNIIVILQQLLPADPHWHFDPAFFRSTVEGTAKFYSVDEEQAGTASTAANSLIKNLMFLKSFFALYRNWLNGN